MNKHLVLAAALVAGSLAAGAQTQTVKAAEQAMKSGKSAAEVVEIVTPAFTNPETQGLAQTYYIPGKAMFEEYDRLFGLKSLGKLPENGDKKMGDDLLQGYKFYMQALPLDSVADSKGKIKTKHSKDIVNTISGHANDYNTAAISFWDLKEYANAYRAWDIFLNLYEREPFASKMTATPDTVLGEIYFNQALAAWQADMLSDAMNAFAKAEKKGYHKKQLYDYAIAVATGLKDQNAIADWATRGNELYGDEDPNYIGHIINTYLQNKDFDRAFSTIDEAIAKDPDNAQYYMVKGILYDNQENKPMAKEMFFKAISLDPKNTGALTQYGIALCQEAYKLSDSAPTTAAESQAYFDSKIKPLFVEAAEYLEKAWQLDNDNMDALNYLDNIYYNLGDEAKQKEIQNRKL